MAANFSKPVTADLYADVLSEIRDNDQALSKMDYSGASNIPTGAKRLNETDKTIESYNGATWDVKMSGVPTGAVISGFYTAAPTGWLLLQGSSIGSASSGATALASATAAELFTSLWNSLTNTEAPVSGGRGASAAADFAANKTLTLPDMRQKFPIGKAASGTGATLGGTGGAIDHTHTAPAHTHGLNDHTHSIPSHTHTVPKHSHDSRAAGATINITASGTHVHGISTRGGGSADMFFSTVFQFGRCNNGAGSSFSYATTDFDASGPGQGAGPTHTHSNSDFGGKVGCVTGGQDGDSDFASGAYSGTSGGSGALTTNSGGNSATTGNNPPFISLNFIIKI